MALRLDGYVRVSRVGGRTGDGYISPDVQKEAIAAYAQDLGGSIVAWQSDEDFSGGTLERPGFQAALARLRGGESDGIVVMRVDRFARSVADGAAIVREIVDRGQVFASCHERMDPRTPEGRYMLTSFLNNAELQLAQLSASWETAKDRAVARGAHIGPTPIGYTRIPKGQKGGGRLLPDPAYAPAITELFQRAARREEGPSALSRWMTQRAPRSSGLPWQPSEIRRWLRNRVYLGEVHYGERVNADAHEGLTDLATWQRVQVEPGVQRRASTRFLLSGVLRCACCCYSMGGFTYGGSKHDTPVYRCGSRTRGCAEPPVITAARLEEFVIGLVQPRLDGLVVEGVSDAAGALVDIERDLAEAEQEVETYVLDIGARRRMGDTLWQLGLDARLHARDAKAAERDATRATDRLTAIAKLGASIERHELRDVLHGMIRHIFVRRQRGVPASERVLVIWSDDPRTFNVPGPHRPGPFEPVRW